MITALPSCPASWKNARTSDKPYLPCHAGCIPIASTAWTCTAAEREARGHLKQMLQHHKMCTQQDTVAVLVLPDICIMQAFTSISCFCMMSMVCILQEHGVSLLLPTEHQQELSSPQLLAASSPVSSPSQLPALSPSSHPAQFSQLGLPSPQGSASAT